MKILRSISSLLLAGLVLIASIGVNVNQHICGGRVQSTALFASAKPCKGAAMTCLTGRHMNSKGCCQEKSILLKGKETNQEVRTAAQLTPSFHLIAVILPTVYSLIDFDSAVATPRYAHYKPPMPDRNIPVLVQSFLI